MADCKQRQDRLPGKVKGKFCSKGRSRKSAHMRQLNSVSKQDNEIVSYEVDHSYMANNLTSNPEADDIAGDDLGVGLCIETCGTEEDVRWNEGRRIVELKFLADQLVCKRCNNRLHLCNIVNEKRYGLGSLLYIKCDSSICEFTNTVCTGKRNEKGAFDINSKVALAMIHSGMGPTHVVNFLSTCNIPPIDATTLRKKEKEISASIVCQAKESCQRAREEEMNATADQLESSFDAGWQTRGSGCQYNSNTGHASLIGVHSGKVLEYDVRSKICRVCQYHFGRNETVPNHDCSSNWSGSSKAMEPDMASAMLNRMREDGCEVQTIHADNDSTTAARLKNMFPSLQKKQDKNHLKKNLTKQLYKLAKIYKQLKPAGTISYMVRCFMYAISTKYTSEEELMSKLEMVVPHMFGDHSLCEGATWCTYHKNPLTFSFKHLSKGQPLSGDQLRTELDNITENYKKMASQLLKLGSTQSNENFNNVVASKAPKNRSYGGTASLATRVSAAVLQKNIGYRYIEEVNRQSLLSPGKVSKRHGITMDKKKLWHKKRHASISFKRKRLSLKKRKHERESTNCLKEGKTYEPCISTSEVNSCDLETIPGKREFNGEENIVAFDLETTGLSRSSDIIQLAAFDGKEEFNIYVSPSQQITKKASEITGLKYDFDLGCMFSLGREVECVDIRLGLLKMIEYLSKREKTILVGHNILSFDIPILCKTLQVHNLLQEFLLHVHACLDTLRLARKLFSKETVGNYKQQTLVQVLLGKSYQAHDALADVKTLHELFVSKFTFRETDAFPFNFHALQKSFGPVVERKLISNANSRKLANSGLGLGHLYLAYHRDNDTGVKSVLSEHGFNAKTSKRIHAYFEKQEE
ncbi:uncharacterized protein LOC133177209 [Saccostrea echinata]|uniref:uncharacterized protein LOC133177209 n=1 Tax=Saccostrea echinata TaxID=191078 RepID=UPI002A821AE5|nr:uncharacterized protein LOC133177209 [Saccostrea echinata]